MTYRVHIFQIPQRHHRFLAIYFTGMHHICIEVNDIKSAMQDLKAQNIKLLSDEPKIGAHGKPVRDTDKKLF